MGLRELVNNYFKGFMKNKQIISDLIQIGVVGFPQRPITFKSGIKSPVYLDNRRWPFFPIQWQGVIRGLAQIAKGLSFDIIAGMAVGGIPHSAALAFYLAKPHVFVRKKTKDHGTAKLVEGGSVKGKKVLFIEDHVTFGGSSLAGIGSVISEGGRVTDCLSITSYSFAEAEQNFQKAKIKLHVLAEFEKILQKSKGLKMIDDQKFKQVISWTANPRKWRSL